MRSIRPVAAGLSGLAVVVACVSLLRAQPATQTPSTGRVIVVSLDGMGTRLFLDDPVGQELRALARVRARGVMAEGLVSHMPSTTANTHAALWTGAWGDVNGISSNEIPLPPRGEHRATDKVSGYRSDALRAEPMWVAAARQRVPVVAQQGTQIYPLTERTTGGPLATPPVLLHGYQAPTVAPARWLGQDELTKRACEPEDRRATTCVSWTAGTLSFRGALVARQSGKTTLRVRVEGNAGEVEVDLAATEHEPPRGRGLARHFSKGLLVDIAGVPPVMAYFRLFEATPDGRVVLFQSPLQETVLYTAGRPATRDEVVSFLKTAGGFVGNGKYEPWDAPGVSGVPLALGGDGTRERRYLETLELGIRQTIVQARALWGRHQPRLMVSYVSMPDELDHTWLGQARQDPRFEPFRRWGYQLVDRAVETYASFATASDHVVFVSDHGMAPTTHEVRVNVPLRDAGLVTAGSGTAVDVSRSKILVGRNCLSVHTTAWKDGLVAPADADAVLDQALTILRGIRSPEDGSAVVTGVFRSPADRERLGFGGPNGFDACLDLKPGYMLSTWLGDGPVVRAKPRPTGEHGFLPTRPEMQGILIGAGPRLPRGTSWPLTRAIDVAPLVSDLLGIDPPRDARGVSPLR